MGLSAAGDGYRGLSPWSFLLIFLFPAGALIAAVRGDSFWVVPWITALVILPLIDMVIPTETTPLEPPQRETGRSIYTWIILAYAPVQIALTAYVLWVACTQNLPLVAQIGIVVTLGLSNGAIGFTLAHELVHRTATLERMAGRMILLGLAYPHWAVEHVRGHHRYVGTPRDPATARFGEMFWLFLPRTLSGQVKSGFELEGERLKKIGKRAWSTDNEVLRMTAIEVLILIGLYAWLGWLGIAYYALQIVVAVTLLEATNYCQHYGLYRREIAPGRYEPQAPRHSWNSYHCLTNRYIIELGRHSDHHAQPGRPYHLLRVDPTAPQLPASYGAMISVALFPPLWFLIMNPRVKAWNIKAGEAQAGGLPGEGAAA
ncbi:MAG TPA: alkane 1-monooxygenase [Magnetospirillaceae bacterium]|jgi:alkane 1-monooxygenase